MEVEAFEIFCMAVLKTSLVLSITDKHNAKLWVNLMGKCD